MMSAFGISWNEQQTSVNDQPVNVDSMPSFVKALRAKPQNSTVASSMYSADRFPEDSNSTVEEFPNVIVGYEQGTAIPYVMDRQGAVRLMTRKGQIIGDDPYRLHGIADSTKIEGLGVKDDFAIEYQVPETTQNKIIPPFGPAVPAPLVEPSRPIPYCYPDHLARLEGKEYDPSHDALDQEWEHVEAPADVPVSKFSPYDSDSPPHHAGVFRSVSTKVKGSFRRRRLINKNKISAPLNDFRRESPGSETRAIPIKNPAPELAERSGCPGQSKEPSRHYPHALKTRPSRRKPHAEQKPASPPARPAEPRKVKVVGQANRMTEFGDMIDAWNSPSGLSEEFGVRELPSDEDYSILEIKAPKPAPLYPARRPVPGTKVDTSKHSWMPPTTPTLPKTSKVTSQHDWRMDEEYPSVDGLFDVYTEIDRQIAEMGIADDEKPAANREVRRLNRMLDRPVPGKMGLDFEDDEPELIVDTFMHDRHSSWVATERPDASTATSTRQQFDQQTFDVSSGEDEAKELMERLRRMRAGELF